VSQTLPSADETDDAASVDPPGRMDKWRARVDGLTQAYQRRAQDHPVLGVPMVFLERYTSRQGVLLASAIAFRLFLWLLPLALLAAGILAKVSTTDGSDVKSAAKEAGLTGAASQQVVTALRNGDRSWVVAVVTGGVLFLWATRTLMRNLTVVNAHAWSVRVPRIKPKDVLINTLAFAVAWVAVFACTAAVHQLTNALPDGGVVLAIVFQGAALTALWFLIARRLPDSRYDWVDLIPGTLVFGFGMSIMDTFGRIYLPARFAHSSAMYGSLGIAAVMLAWLLLIGQLIVTAALTNTLWSDYRATRRNAQVGTN